VLVVAAAAAVVVVVALLHLPHQVLTLEQLLLVIHSDSQLVDLLQAVPRLSSLPSSTLVHLPRVLLSLSAVNQHLLLLVILICHKQQRPSRLEARTPGSAHLHLARPSALLLRSHPPLHLEAHYSLLVLLLLNLMPKAELSRNCRGAVPNGEPLFNLELSKQDRWILLPKSHRTSVHCFLVVVFDHTSHTVPSIRSHPFYLPNIFDIADTIVSLPTMEFLTPTPSEFWLSPRSK